MQVLHHPEGALLGTLRFHQLGKAEGTRAPHLGRGGQSRICGWMAEWPGVRICPLGLSTSNVTDPLRHYLKRRHKEIETNSVYLTRYRGEPGAEAVRQAEQAVGVHSLGDKEVISRQRQKNLKYCSMNLGELKDGRNKVTVFIIS